MNTPVSLKCDSSSATLEYELLETHVDDWEQMSYTTYGIRATGRNGKVLVEYTDISTSKRYVEDFMNILKSHDVAAVHIGDLLEDYLD